MLASLLSGGSITEFIIGLILRLPIVMLALSLHETAHGYVALKLGDPTAQNYGRLTLNPTKHFDPLGFLCMVLFGFGWAKPVPINARYFKNPKRGMALSAAAGAPRRPDGSVGQHGCAGHDHLLFSVRIVPLSSGHLP